MPPEPSSSDFEPMGAADAPAPREASSAKPKRRLAQTAGSIAGNLAMDHRRGEAAELRRLDSGLSPAFYRLHIEHGLRAIGPRAPDENEGCWATILQAFATMVGLHDYDVPLGKAMVEAGVSELRFVKLVRSRGDSLAPQIRGIAQRLASAHVRSDHSDLADLVVSDALAHRDPAHERGRDRIRRKLARDFFRSLHSSKVD